ncbi:MAG: HAD-IIIC family phosphatase, partial [Desulfovibrio sp.]|nr:HAD-IIIC family phosphatase [Desulfovibrio sp.]
YLALSDMRADFWYSGYDDSLSFADSFPQDVAVHILWFDAARHHDQAGAAAWLCARTAALRALTQAKILVAGLGLGAHTPPALPDVMFLDMEATLSSLGEEALDIRLAPWSGTRLSHAACLAVARELGTHALPSLLCPLLKAIVLDCDNTLYAGVLGEDGVAGCQPYKELQTWLHDMAGKGFLLALASKNEERDVRELFLQREDFPLRWEDFAAYGINWRSKAENMANIARTLHIGTDAMLFVDDNPGELAHVQAALPDVQLLEATSPEDTLAGLRHYPRLVKTTVAVEDTLRSTDLRANASRDALRQSLSPEEYLRSLHIRLTFLLNPLEKAQRCQQLCNKTNQFIFSYLRPTEMDVARYLEDDDCCVVAVGLQDRLSDSGIIAVLLARNIGNMLAIDEFVMSCRALGRGVENFIIGGAVRLALRTLSVPSAQVQYKVGPRNTPALEWLRTVLGVDSLDTHGGCVVLPDDLTNIESMTGYDCIDVEERTEENMAESSMPGKYLA